MEMTPKTVYVIVVTYRGRQWYDRCFRSLRESKYAVHTVVIDNASGDGSVDYISENYPDVHLIRSDRNLGFGNANNLGIKYALEQGCDYVFLLNQDAWIEPDTIENLIQAHRQHPEYGVLSPMHMTKEKDHLNFLLDDGNRNYELLSDLFFGTVKDVYDIEYVNAAGWLVSRNTLMTIGGFCPIIFHYGEDDDYLHRMKYHGVKVGLCPHSRMVHDSKNKLGEAVRLFEKANEERIDEYLDINKSIDLSVLKRRFLFKGIVLLFRCRRKQADEYLKRFRFLAKNGKDIERCRSQHMIKQSNWLV